MVIVDVAGAVAVTCTCAGLKEQVGADAGVGETEQVKVVVPVKPPDGLIVTVAVLDWPGATEPGVGDAGTEMPKSGGAGLIVRAGFTLTL
jgi:hypothetical protein